LLLLDYGDTDPTLPLSLCSGVQRELGKSGSWPKKRDMKVLRKSSY
jgi:hypothetical protein